jgi:hypothetical protein
VIALPTPARALSSEAVNKGRAPEQAEFFVGSHEGLFEPIESPKCDACGEPLIAREDEGYGVPGSGAYLWIRGGRVSIERVPLCASCASAIGMTALARWEIEEEEG